MSSDKLKALVENMRKMNFISEDMLQKFMESENIGDFGRKIDIIIQDIKKRKMIDKDT